MDHSHHAHAISHTDHSSHGVELGMDQNSTDGGMDMGMGMGMQMTFYASVNATILFDGWTVSSAGGLAGSAIGIFFLAIIYESLKYFREYLFRRSHASLHYQTVSNGEDATKIVQGVKRSIRKRILSTDHFIQTGLHIVQVTLSYFLMLIFMTYNAYLCVAIIVGAGVGFFIFGWKKTIVVDITEHCH